MADDPHNTSDLSDPVVATDSPKEDAETKATREELRHTAISEKNSQAAPELLDEDGGEPHAAAGDKQEAAPRAETPQLDMLDSKNEEALREQVSSPKKKRAHDEVDEHKDATEPTAADKPEGDGIPSRTDRTEPEKKRPRDKQVDDALKGTKNAEARFSPTASDVGSPRLLADDLARKENSKVETEAGSLAATAAANENKPAATSSSAFASSGFAKLTGSASPFGTLAGNPKASVFGGGTSSGSASPFGALGGGPAAKPAAPTLNFTKSDTSGSASPFSSLNGPSTTFGSAFGGGFGGSFGGPKLTSFGKPGEVLKSDKPARPFGAPESDAENGSESGSADDDDSGAEDEGDEKELAEEAKATIDDKKKPKLQRVEVDSGESGEATILSVRARLYVLDRGASVWKERGAGMLKVNVPKRCVEFDDKNQPIPASFDASTLEDDDDDDDDDDQSDGKPTTSSKIVRLLMRQDSTHRVILNSVLMASTKFQERQTLKATSVLFVAIEGDDPVSFQIKMNAMNAQNFLAMMTGIQKEMRGD